MGLKWGKSMFELGGYELLVVLIIGLLVLGPEKLPQVMGMVSRAFRDFRKYADEIKRDINEEVVDGVRQVRQEVKQVQNEMEIPRFSARDFIDPEEILDKEDISAVEDAIKGVNAEAQPDETIDSPSAEGKGKTKPPSPPPV